MKSRKWRAVDAAVQQCFDAARYVRGRWCGAFGVPLKGRLLFGWLENTTRAAPLPCAQRVRGSVRRLDRVSDTLLEEVSMTLTGLPITWLEERR